MTEDPEIALLLDPASAKELDIALRRYAADLTKDDQGPRARRVTRLWASLDETLQENGVSLPDRESHGRPELTGDPP